MLGQNKYRAVSLKFVKEEQHQAYQRPTTDYDEYRMEGLENSLVFFVYA